MTLFLSRFSRVVVCLLMITVSLAAEAALPRWVRHHPKADNDTYYYVVEDATNLKVYKINVSVDDIVAE